MYAEACEPIGLPGRPAAPGRDPSGGARAPCMNRHEPPIPALRRWCRRLAAGQEGCAEVTRVESMVPPMVIGGTPMLGSRARTSNSYCLVRVDRTAASPAGASLQPPHLSAIRTASTPAGPMRRPRSRQIWRATSSSACCWSGAERADVTPCPDRYRAVGTSRVRWLTCRSIDCWAAARARYSRHRQPPPLRHARGRARAWRRRWRGAAHPAPDPCRVRPRATWRARRCRSCSTRTARGR